MGEIKTRGRGEGGGARNFMARYNGAQFSSFRFLSLSLSLSLSFSIVKTNRSIEQTSLSSCFHIFQRLDDIENFYAAANDKIQAT